jgi:uncharacterized protein YjiK
LTTPVSTFAQKALRPGLLVALLAMLSPAHVLRSAQAVPTIILSEVHPSGSGNGTYAADWFEITNTETFPVSIAGWKVDDDSGQAATAVSLRGVATLPPNRSVIFVENSAVGVLDATVIQNFSTAWFGTPTPPRGVLIGAYGAPGSGVGLSASGDAVHLFDASGARLSAVRFGAATAGTTFDNAAGIGSDTTPPPPISTLSVAGVNGAFVSANATETGSPGRRRDATSLTTIDLSTYVRVGRFDLPEPTRTPAPAGSVLAQEVSGVTYNWDTNTLFVVGDGGTSVVQVTKTGALVDSMTLAPGSSPQNTEFYDPEGIAYVGGGRFVMVEERDRQAVLFTYAAGSTLTRAATQSVKLGTFAPNIGLEGLSFDPQTGGFIFAKETAPQGVFQSQIDFAAGTATNGSPTTENSIDLFDPALANLLDLADVYALSNVTTLSGAESSHLLLLSQESAKVVKLDRQGAIAGALTIVSDPGNPLSVASQQHEGLTMDDDGLLYIVSENGGGGFDFPQLWVYAPSSVPNQAPTAIALTNQIATLPENTSTATRLKVANVAVTDDGLGTNVLSVAGPDASAFEVDDSGLYVKAGVVLDFEVQSTFAVTVSVDDTGVGNTPDASATYALMLTDVDESGPTGALVISEVAPWASGNSPYGADWFEVRNTGANAVDLAGWKMDDGSSALATAVALNGIATIGAGESVIFLETDNLSAIAPAFLDTWFGPSPAVTPRIGSYAGAGVGLSTGGDGVTLFDSAGNVRASVTFGASPAGPFPSFDNTAGVNNAAIAQLSVVGTNGAFAAAKDSLEIGSPGDVPGPVGRLVVTEVAPWSSGNSPIGADWFEVTNVGAAPVALSGWEMDDNSESPVAAVALNGVASIAPGESVVFIESTDLAAARTVFLNTWFGANPPPGLQIGGYAGGAVSLSTGGDAVNLYDPGSVLRAKVFFGPSPAAAPFGTFDNAAGVNDAGISQFSVAGVNGAFVAANDPNEIGSPGRVANPVVLPDVVISEVSPWSNNGSPYRADWFEVTNIGATPVSTSGWKVDDGSNAVLSAVSLRGVSSIPAGQSAVFVEGDATGAGDAALIAAFSQAWFGSPTLPAGFLIGVYGGTGIGLSNDGDALNLFDAGGNRITGVSFGAATTGITFDNAAGVGGRTLPLPAISLLSVVGVNGAFQAVDGVELGSPGTVTTSCATNVTAQLAITRGAFLLNRVTRRFQQVVTLRNTGAAIGGPVALVLDGLAQSVTVVGAAGTTSCQAPKGSPYVQINVGGNATFDRDERVSLTLEFANPANTAIAYTPRVLAGTAAR